MIFKEETLCGPQWGTASRQKGERSTIFDGEQPAPVVTATACHSL